MSEINAIKSQEFFKALYDGSAYTITGAGGPIEEWKRGYNNILKGSGIPSVDEDEWYMFTGKDYNEYFKLTGKNKYFDDLVFLAFTFDKLTIEEVQRLSIIKISRGDRWFDDIVANDLESEGRGYHYHDERCSFGDTFEIKEGN